MIRARGAGRRHAATWPGFVDAMTGLLLVLMFVLTIFTVVQFTLRDQISGQESRLQELSAEVASLADALGLSQAREAGLSEDLAAAGRNAEAQELLIEALAGERDEAANALASAEGRITDFEAQVAGLLAERDEARGRVADLEAANAQQVDEAEALNLALAAARDEVDAEAEVARLAAARADALRALVTQLGNDTAEGGERLSDAEAARAAEAAAAEALRARLRDADAELTAMTLTLEEERREAEETLTLLAAAEAANEDLDQRLAQAILARNRAAEERDAATAEGERLDARLLAALSVTESTEAELAAAQDELAAAQAEGEELSTRLAASLADRELSAGNLQAAQEALEAALAEGEAARADLDERLAAAVLARDAAEARAAEQVAAERARADTEASRAVAAEETATLLAQEQEDLSAALTAALLRAEAAEADAAARGTSEEDLRDQLAQALARIAAAEAEAGEALTEAEQQAALLAVANDRLIVEEALSAEGRREVEALNQQVAALRSEVASLQGLLGEAEAADTAADVQIEALGADLNAALARAASEERARADAEAARAEAEAELRARAEAEAEDLASYRSEFFGNIRRLVEGREGVQVVGDRFVFSSEVLFPPGSATLSPSGRAQIAGVADLLRDIAGDIPPEIDWVIQVDGHTDDTPIAPGAAFADNWDLSQARALSVVRQMSETEGIPAERLSANGFGEYQPLDPADTDEARARNRRIEIKLTER